MAKKMVKLGSVKDWNGAIKEAKVLQSQGIVLMAKSDSGVPYSGMRIGIVLGYNLYIEEKDLEKWKKLKRPHSAYTDGL